MNRSILTWVAAALALFLCAWFSLRETARVRRAEAQLSSIETQINDARAKMEALNTRVRALAPSSAKDNLTIDATATPSATEKRSSAPRAMTQSPQSRPWLSRVFAENPRIQALYLDAYRKDLELRHSPRFRELGLTRDEVVRLLDISAKDMETASDIGAATRAQNMSSADPAIQAQNAQRKRDRDETLLTLLGPERMKQWQERSPLRLDVDNTLSQLITTLHATSTPLSLFQANQLTTALDRKEGLSLSASPRQYGLLDDATYDAVLSKAAAILTPPQLEGFQTLIAAQKARRTLNDLARGDRPKRPPVGGAVPPK